MMAGWTSLATTGRGGCASGGMTFRDIAAQTGTSLTRVRTSLREAKGGREVRAEIRRAGGLHGWWRS